MISDIFKPEDRAKAMATYALGVNLGIMVGFILGGILNQIYGWRITFIIMGVPGILLAIWVRAQVTEPVRGWSEGQKPKTEPVPFRQILPTLISNPAIVHITLGGALAMMGGLAYTNWAPSFSIRVHGMSTAELGVWLAGGIGIFGAIGVLSMGYLTDKFGSKRRGLYMKLPAIGMILSAPIAYYVLSTPEKSNALVASLFFPLLSTCYLGPVIATLHSLVEPRIRAMTSAIYFLVANVIGLGLGPLLVGAISDALVAELGSDSIRMAMLYVSPPAVIWAGLHIYWAGRHLARMQ